jgi:hypothetical protein
MPLKKLAFRSGVNRENTRYTNENGWYDCDKIRFRQGTPEKIGGWSPVTPNNAYLGTCRSLWAWATNTGVPYLGTGTNLKYYINAGFTYSDITPLRATTAAGDVTFAATDGFSTITVTDVGFGSSVGDFVTFSGALTLGGNITAAVLNQNYQIVTVIDSDHYTISTFPVLANASDTGNGGIISPPSSATVGKYEIPVGGVIELPAFGWGAGPWDGGGWGTGSPGVEPMRVWNAQNFGQDLVYGYQGGAFYYWNAAAVDPLDTRGVLLSSLAGASDVPLMQNVLLVSDVSRFVFAFGTNDYGEISIDPMLIRWSDQESAVNWTPASTNQAGSLRLSHGSYIVAVAQTRQEILVWTNTALYSLQYIGSPLVWGAKLLSDNITILSDRAWATAAGVTYWMGADKFYAYDGRVTTMKCDLRQYIFDDVPGFNNNQETQVFASTLEKFNEVWWFYCSAGSTTIDKYVVYNYVESIWYYGEMARTAWIDSGVISHFPVAADSTVNKLMFQETGTDDLSTGATVPIEAFITSAEFDLDDGNNFSFVWRVLPDVTFRGSTAANPALTMYLLPLANSGSGYNNNTSTNSNQSVASQSSAAITRSSTYPVEQFTGQINTRVRGRQMSIKIESTEAGIQWQVGSPRIDIRPDGRR